MTECNKCFHYTVCNGDIGFGYAECPEFTSKENMTEIVRCKDCKHCNKYTKWNNQEYLGCSWNGEIYEVEAEHYCSYGERK